MVYAPMNQPQMQAQRSHTGDPKRSSQQPAQRAVAEPLKTDSADPRTYLFRPAGNNRDSEEQKGADAKVTGTRIGPKTLVADHDYI